MEQRNKILTPESVSFEFTPAGLGTRGIAAFIDTMIIGLLQVAVLVGATVTNWVLFERVGLNLYWVHDIVAAIALFFSTLVLTGYHLYFELFRNGQTPGKRRMGIQVVRENGQALTLVSSGIRNVVRLIDFIPGCYGVGLISAMFSARGKSLGDFAAGTLVVHVAPDAARVRSNRPVLSEQDEIRLAEIARSVERTTLQRVETFLQSRGDLTAAARIVKAKKLSNEIVGSATLAGQYHPEDILVWIVQLARN